MALTRLRAIPDLPAAALFSDMSRPGAEALGFLPITRFTLWRKARPGHKDPPEGHLSSSSRCTTSSRDAVASISTVAELRSNGSTSVR